MQFSPQGLHLVFGFFRNNVTISICVINSGFSMPRKQADFCAALPHGPEGHPG